jgi:hypothetical protein
MTIRYEDDLGVWERTEVRPGVFKELLVEPKQQKAPAKKAPAKKSGAKPKTKKSE